MVKELIQKGFSLVEVLFALAIFAVFSLGIITTQSSNITSSTQMSKDLTTFNLAKMKMNEVLITRNEFTNATENDPESGNFEIDGYKEYKYLVEFKKNEFPDFSQIIGKSEEETDQDETSAMQKKVYSILKENLEEILWQVTVTVTSPEGDSFKMSSWVNKANAKVKINL